MSHPSRQKSTAGMYIYIYTLYIPWIKSEICVCGVVYKFISLIF